MAVVVREDRLSETFAALANPTRRAILSRLAHGAANVNDLAEPFNLTLPAISKHIKVLERAGLITRGHRAQYRPCTLDAAPLEEISTWAEQYRPVWETRPTGWTTTSPNSDGHRRTPKDTEGQTMTDTTSRDAIVIERTFDEPAALIWKLWTDPEPFAAWYGPAGAAISVVTMDVRVGGRRLVGMRMQTPNGEMQMWFTGEHLEVAVNQRLVYTESMCDQDGKLLAPSDMGMPEGHPTTTTVTLELHEVAGRTTLLLTHSGVPADSLGAAGWQMALDKLAGYLGGLSPRSA